MAQPGHEADALARRLTAAMARGDRGALGEFYAIWFNRAYTLARTLTRRDESFCLDAVQEAMLRVVRSVRPMHSRSDVDRWMTRVVHTTALDLLRRDSRRAARERARGASAAHALGAAGGGGAAELAERIAWVRTKLAELPASEGWLLWLRLARGKTLEQAGSAAGVTGNTAHGRIRRGLARLRDSGREQGHD